LEISLLPRALWQAALSATSLLKRRTDDGKYYCEMCIEKTYYPTRKDIWERHSFEPLLEWIKSLTPDTYVCLYGIPEESMWGSAFIN
jgi:hypothetical protein